MIFTVIFYCISLLLGLCATVVGIFVNLISKDNSLKIIGLALLFVGMSVFFLSLEIPQKEQTKEEVCVENSISYILVETVHEATQIAEDDIITIFKYASSSGMEVYDAISMLDSTLTEEEIKAIVTMSDMRQAANGETQD